MDLITRCSCLLVIISVVAFTNTSSAPMSSRPAPGSQEELHNIILELENVVFKLKDYAYEMKAAASRKESQQGGEGKAEVDELQRAASGGAGAKPRVPAAQQQNLEGTSDISLREALEYLVSLAKQKKVEKRDHDIPFPITDTDREDK